MRGIAQTRRTPTEDMVAQFEQETTPGCRKPGSGQFDGYVGGLAKCVVHGAV
jgi:hypothetical protein